MFGASESLFEGSTKSMSITTYSFHTSRLFSEKFEVNAADGNGGSIGPKESSPSGSGATTSNFRGMKDPLKTEGDGSDWRERIRKRISIDVRCLSICRSTCLN